MRYLWFSLLALSSCGPRELPAPSPAPAASATAIPALSPVPELTVTYRDAANVFEILDNVTNWWRGKCDPEYREDWQRRFGLTSEDEKRFATYKEIRKRYYAYPPDSDETDPTKTVNGLFAPRKLPDRIAEAFYGAATVQAAIAKLHDFMTPEDVETLTQFYEAYRAPCEVLLAESAAYSEIAATVQQKLDSAQAGAFYRRVAEFYGVREAPRFTVLYVWWPAVEHIEANNRGQYLILKYNPVRHRVDALNDIDLPVHELTHHVSQHQPDAQKQALTRVFLGGCDIASAVPIPKILEEPLAEAQQKLFLRTAAPDRLDFSVPWYSSDPWVDAFSKAIYGPVSRAYDSGDKMSAALMEQLATACRTLKPPK